ncbi:peptidase M43 family protein [Metarhizium robertsii]|uniref:Peptidase M43 family protein n=1 Tax=Metarhizium robertsii TaxID=568076 RepID=A0A014MV25_9HYPO|nr:peptidase M43 family protein [Metarhizium robertsii]
MLSSALLTGLLAASALATPAAEDKDDSDLESQKIYDSHKLLVAMEKNHTGNYSHVNVDVYTHVILASDTEWNITQLEILNTNFQPADISFALQGAKWVIEPDWVRGDNDDMQKALHEGGSNALNIYFMNYDSGGLERLASASFPSELESTEGPLLDGLLITKNTPLSNKGLLTHETGHWFGLLHPFQDIFNDDGDYIDDTPISPKSCYDKLDAATCHTNNYMGYGGDPNMFTAGQITRMHSFWNVFRSSGTAVPELVLAPIESISKGRTRLPFYPEPGNRRELYRRCHPKHNDGAQETRENYCGTNAFCRWELFKLAGEKYSSIDACLNARTVELLPWIMPKTSYAHYCHSKTSMSELPCGTETFCGVFDNNTATDGVFVDSRSNLVEYNSSSECLEAREPAPQDSRVQS